MALQAETIVTLSRNSKSLTNKWFCSDHSTRRCCLASCSDHSTRRCCVASCSDHSTRRCCVAPQMDGSFSDSLQCEGYPGMGDDAEAMNRHRCGSVLVWSDLAEHTGHAHWPFPTVPETSTESPAVWHKCDLTTSCVRCGRKSLHVTSTAHTV
ncbi:hypothetical protein AALO_G00145070 [Alosa alosa]|uniref:Uncharacterized protein n=1 Tax=Alosa alosa TaxID=278164 RepID=A0AAV6GQS2_9TELE|nr:hypothetical protein AALO_G00145070 [Alosa alosa]